LEKNLMRVTFFVSALSICVLASTAQAGWYGEHGNDTGGIIPWSPAVSQIYWDVAANHCAQYNKVPHITSVHPWYGDYVGFTCAFPRGYDPVKAWYAPYAYAPPATLYYARPERPDGF
jgi:hypothetical protein